MAEKVARTVFVVTGHRLTDGRVQYLRADRTWGSDLDAAVVLEDAPSRDELLAWAQQTQSLTVTGIYPIEIGITDPVSALTTPITPASRGRSGLASTEPAARQAMVAIQTDFMVGRSMTRPAIVRVRLASRRWHWGQLL